MIYPLFTFPRTSVYIWTCVLVLACSVGLVAAQEFDENFDHWPLKHRISGTIVLLNQVADTSAIDQWLSKDAIPKTNIRRNRRSKTDSQEEKEAEPNSPEKKKRMLAIRLGGWDDDAKEVFKKRLGRSYEMTFRSLRQTAGQGKDKDQGDETENLDAADVDLVYLASPQRESKKLDASEIRDGIVEISKSLTSTLDRGGILVAENEWIRWLSRVVITGGNRHAVVAEGLGLVPDSILEPRFSGPNDQLRVQSALVSHPRTFGVGIQADSALVLKGRKFFLVGSGEATFFLAANQRQPRRVQTIRVGVKERDPNRLLIDLTEWRRDAIDRTLPPFPPADPKPPVVKSGKLFIVGGGGMPKGLMTQFIEAAGGAESAKLVYVPCSEREDVGERQGIVQLWKRMGVAEATFIHTKDRRLANEDESILGPLREATGIWFGGGRQWNFSDSYYGTEAHRLMKEVLKRGGVIGGSSAGASIQARYLARATPIQNFRIMAPGYERGGLGFISGVAIDQHFSQRGRQKDMTQLMESHPQLLGIGLDETTAIVVEGSKATVVGKGKVHFYDRNLPVFPNRPDYVALPAGSVYDLRERKIIKDTTPQETDPTGETPDSDK